MGGEELVFSFVIPLPSAIFVEISSDVFSFRQIISAGNCSSRTDRTAQLLDKPFYHFQNEGKTFPAYNIKDIVDPIGPLDFNLYISYNCGYGRKQEVISYGGEYDVCGARLSPMLDDQDEGVPMPSSQSNPFSVR